MNHRTSTPSRGLKLLELIHLAANSGYGQVKFSNLPAPQGALDDSRWKLNELACLGSTRPHTSATTAWSSTISCPRTPSSALCVEALRMGGQQLQRELVARRLTDLLPLCGAPVPGSQAPAQRSVRRTSMQKKLAKKIGFLPAAQLEEALPHDLKKRGADRCPRRVSEGSDPQRKAPTVPCQLLPVRAGRGSVVAGDRIESAYSPGFVESLPRWAADS